MAESRVTMFKDAMNKGLQKSKDIVDIFCSFPLTIIYYVNKFLPRPRRDKTAIKICIARHFSV